MHIKLFLILSVLCLGIFLRFFQLGSIPNGIDIDEASQGYDAFSLLKTGKDRYGEILPVFMRSFGNYQSPLYTYLTVVPVFIFGLSAFATRFISAFSGVIILICTFFLIINLRHRSKFETAILAMLFLAISPWGVLFSRTAVEANLALALLVSGIFFFVLSFKNRWLFIPACLILALSAYAYPAERIVSVVFLSFFSLLFRKELITDKKNTIIGLTLFLIILIPQFVLINSPGSKKRIGQVQYWSENYFQQNGGNFKNFPFGKYLFITEKFAAQYSSYFSPNNLFFYADEQVIRSMPDMSIFYPWMVIPFILGIRFFLKERSDPVVKILILILLISPIPAAVTREPFYTLRTLPLFWVITIIVSGGVNFFLEKIRFIYLRFGLAIILIFISLALIYNSYFILLKYERMKDFGYYNIRLLNKLEEFKDKNIIVDSTRANLAMWYIFVKKIDPNKLQKDFKQYTQEGYYSSPPDKDYYKIDNFEFKPINFGTDNCKANILAGDPLSISSEQAKEHNLKQIFEIKDLNKKIKFNGFLADPGSKC